MVKWQTDRPTNRLLWNRLSRASLYLLRRPGVERVLDLGGGTGWFAGKVRDRRSDVEVHSIDLEPDDREDGVVHTKGDILNLPYDDNFFQGMTAHAVLHHVPDSIPRALDEAARVLERGSYLVIEEPGGDNLLANIARRFFPTEKHDPDERPVSVESMTGPLKRHFDIVRIEHHFLLSYLAPHVVARIPRPLKGVARGLARFFYHLDRWMLDNLPVTRRYCGYVLIVAKKR